MESNRRPESGRQDSNLRLLGSEPSTLAKLSYTQMGAGRESNPVPWAYETQAVPDRRSASPWNRTMLRRVTAEWTPRIPDWQVVAGGGLEPPSLWFRARVQNQHRTLQRAPRRGIEPRSDRVGAGQPPRGRDKILGRGRRPDFVTALERPGPLPSI